jgi:hypothetical protein
VPVQLAARSKAYVCGRSTTAIVVSNPTGVMDVCLLCVLSGRGLCDELITRPEESYRPWRFVVCHQETSWYEEAIARAGLHSQRNKQTNKQTIYYTCTHSIKLQVYLLLIQSWNSVSAVRKNVNII